VYNKLSDLIGAFEGSFQKRRRELPWVEVAHSFFHALAASMRRVLRMLAMSYFLRSVGCWGVSSFFCKSVSTLIAVDAFMTREPTQPYIPAAFL